MAVIKKDRGKRQILSFKADDTMELTEDLEGFLNFKDGKAIVPINKYYDNSAYKQLLKGERKEVNWDELYLYSRADPVARFACSLLGDLVVSYGYKFDMAIPFEEEISDKDQKMITFLNQLWKDYVGLDEFIRTIVVNGVVFGNFFAEIVFDDKAAPNGWGIKKLKVLDPRTMFVDRAKDGTIKAYYQHPKAHFVTARSVKRSARSIKLHPDQVIHIKFDNNVNKTYGESLLYTNLDTIDMKVGLKGDAVTLAQRRASPFLVWSVGSENRIFSSRLLDEVRGILEAQLSGGMDNDVFVPGFIKVETVGTNGAENANDLVDLVRFLNSEIAVGHGIPDIFIGNSQSSSEAAEAKVEILVRRIKRLQAFIGTELRNKLMKFHVQSPLVDEDSGRIIGRVELSPEEYTQVPVFRWEIIESVSDMRLRVGEMMNQGVMKVNEGREVHQYRGQVKDEELSPDNKKKIEDAKSTRIAAERPPSAGNPTSTPSKSTKSSPTNK